MRKSKRARQKLNVYIYIKKTGEVLWETKLGKGILSCMGKAGIDSMNLFK